jgi:hypothetical protein
MTLTIDVHHHILPDVFWRATNDAHNPVGGISPAPPRGDSNNKYRLISLHRPGVMP